VCGSPANSHEGGKYLIIACSRCGDFQIDSETLFDWSNTPGGRLDASDGGNQRALASYLIRRMQGSKRRILDRSFFASFADRRFHSPNMRQPDAGSSSIERHVLPGSTSSEEHFTGFLRSYFRKKFSERVMYPWPHGEFDYVMDAALAIALDYLDGTGQTVAFKEAQSTAATAIAAAWKMGVRHHSPTSESKRWNKGSEPQNLLGNHSNGI
jgi:hypothetical protein